MCCSKDLARTGNP
ncbi:hypothetical protein F383_24832 [Gossypium arboreum]|nr:hypothetical protein F383_37675 [Gossypium arboreum]KHG07384.1 hypothetical protein F383_34241 [Gossypium arboreum]KHG07550.1 hypothetical protein F383_34548 [Gossypium arboreum]KHG20257.1 hypothetical protein F383_24832 [Gossypium arboreum]